MKIKIVSIKIISILLVATLVMCAAGCGRGKDDVKQPEDAQADVQVDGQPEDAQVQNTGTENAAASSYTGISLDTTDIDGNPVNTADIFAGNIVTMVNIWATWCPPCVGEMPELGKLNNELKEKDCEIVGIIYDGYEEGALNDARAIISQTGATYTMLMPTDDLMKQFPLGAFPTSYFVDSNGEIVGEPIVGAYVDGYRAMIDSLT